MQALELRAEVTADRELRLKLPQDIQYGMVRVIVLYEKEAAREQAPARRRFGQFKGQAEISADFDDALPDTFCMCSSRGEKSFSPAHAAQHQQHVAAAQQPR